MASYRTTRPVTYAAPLKSTALANGRLKAAGLLVTVAIIVLGYWGLHGSRRQAVDVGDVTASLSQAPEQLGPSGLPLPRFVTLKANKVNVRKGPSSDHAVAWVFQRKGMPVEITAEFENWRKIRDSEGGEGWILQSMLSGKRNALVANWSKARAIMLHDNGTDKSATVAKLAPGVIGEITNCNGTWCYMTAQDYEGYAKQNELWGVYPGETLD